jgi:hypothetical protein
MLALTPLPTPPSRPAAIVDAAATARGEGGGTCGWFDSSWELRQGLSISELPASDLVVAALWFPALAAALPRAGLSVQWQ